MSTPSKKVKRKEMTKGERAIFEQGFEEGYSIARRNYEAFRVKIITRNGSLVESNLTPTSHAK